MVDARPSIPDTFYGSMVRTVWSTFAEIHSRYPPRFSDALFGVTGIFDYTSQYNTYETYLIYPMIAISSLLL